MEARGIEPLTSAVRLQRSAKLSYVPIIGFRVRSFEFRAAEKANFEFIENHRMRQGNRFIIRAKRLGRTLRPWRLCVKPSNAETLWTQRKTLFSFENRFALFEEGGDAFFFVFGREADGDKVDLAAEAFVEV